MYTWEINDIMKFYNYNLPSSVYLDICKSSPQIMYITAHDGNPFKIVCKEQNDDGSYYYPEWSFSVYYDGSTD